MLGAQLNEPTFIFIEATDEGFQPIASIKAIQLYDTSKITNNGKKRIPHSTSFC